MELIKIATNNDGKPVVSARQLYGYLTNNANNFTRWSSDNIKNNSFCFEGIDYQTIMHVADNGRKMEDFALTLDFAKKLSMMAKTEKGEAVRQYFIECEKSLDTQNNLPKTFSEALRLAADQAEKIEEQAQLIEKQKPAVEFYHAVAGSNDAIPMGDAAKVLNMGIGRNELFKILRNKKVLMTNNIPYQEYCDRGYFRVVEQKYNKPDGSVHINLKPLVYQRGLQYLKKICENK